MDRSGGIVLRFDRWLRRVAERRWGPLDDWRLSRWLVTRPPMACLVRGHKLVVSDTWHDEGSPLMECCRCGRVDP